MESEKVKEIKRFVVKKDDLEIEPDSIFDTTENKLYECRSFDMQDLCVLLNKLESENERLLESCKNCHYIKDLEITNGHAKELKDRIVELEEQRDRQAYIAEDLIQEKHRWTEQAREETAKKLLNDIKRDAENSYLFDYLFDDEPHIGRSDFIKILNKSAKQFDVEVEE